MAVGSPAARLTHASDRAIGADTQSRPEDLAGIVVDRRAQIHQNVSGPIRWERVPMDTDARGGGEFGADTIVVEDYSVIAGLGNLCAVTKTGAVAGTRLVSIAGVELDVAGNGLYQKVAKIGMTGAGKMSVRKTQDGGVFEAIARGPLVALFERKNLRVGTELDHAEGNGGARKRVAVGASADERIHRVEGTSGIGVLRAAGAGGKNNEETQQDESANH